MWLSLSEWCQRHYQKQKSPATLRRWAKEGHFSPPAEKHGKEWMVQENAKYVSPDNTQIQRLKRAEKMLENADLAQTPDTRVLEIFQHGSQAA